MSMDTVINNEGGEYQDLQRSLSLLLFNAIKPYCVELTQLALLPEPIFNSDSPKLLSVLENIEVTLDGHFQANSKVGLYRLSANIADYVFFPLSNLLKQPSLNEKVISRLLGIVGFLIRYAWSQNVDIKLIDQLYPLILFLIDDKVAAKGTTVIERKSFPFRLSAISAIDSLIKCLPEDYFADNAKNLAMLGSSTTILLDTLTSLLNPSSQEEITLVLNCILTTQELYSRISPEQLSHILPGTVSRLINFTTTSKSLHFSIICKILKLLRILIVKVFSDKDLDVSIDVTNLQPDLLKLNEIWENPRVEGEAVLKTDKEQIKIEIPASNNQHRTTSWLFATAKQLKISLTILFRTLLTSSGNRLKVQTKSQVAVEIVSFVDDILKHCFISLFKDFCSIALDVLSMLISILTYDEKNSFERTAEEEYKIEEYASLVIYNVSFNAVDNENLQLFYNHVKLKLSDFINNKLTTTIYSTDDEKINSYIVSLKFMFKILSNLSKEIFTDEDEVQVMRLKLIKLLKKQLADCFIFNSQIKKKSQFPFALNGHGDMNMSENKLDNIELPPHINAHKLTQVNEEQSISLISNGNAYTDNLLILSNNWPNIKSTNDSSELSPNYFKGMYSEYIEYKFVNLLKYIANLGTPEASKSLTTIENLLIEIDTFDSENSTYYLDRAISLWMANNLLSAYKSKGRKILPNVSNGESFDVNDFLVFDEKDDTPHSPQLSQGSVQQDTEEMSYLIMGKAQEVIDEVTSIMNSPEKVSTKNTIQLHRVYEFAYSAAIDSIGELSNHISYSDFQSDFLIDYLYPLLEALSFQSNSLIQTHAVTALDSVVKNYYNGSLESLIMDNLDYLIDCLSLKLSVVSTMTPALPGILLIIFKIAGIKLLLANQLLDILTKMFILIDSYHGYSVLVEGLFIVFEELVKQIKHEYIKDVSEAVVTTKKTQLYKPWGLTNYKQVLALIDDSNKLLDPMNDYDSSREYFQRKPDTAFEEQLTDSDDEDDDNGLTQSGEDQEAIWDSCIPKNIYFIVQKIFNYGFRMLSHPSITLKIQILKTLISIYPILVENFQLALPIISQHWSLLLTLISGTSTLSSFVENQSNAYASDNLIIAALELGIKIICEDKKKGERFLAKRFVEAWEQVSAFSKISDYIVQSKSKKSSELKKLPTSEKTLSRAALNPKLVQSYVKFIISGLNTYERAIPDLMAFDMIKFCYKMGLPNDQYMSTETQNILWVVKHERSI